MTMRRHIPARCQHAQLHDQLALAATAGNMCSMLRHDGAQDELRSQRAAAADAAERGNAAANDAGRWQDECMQLRKEVATLQNKCALPLDVCFWEGPTS